MEDDTFDRRGEGGKSGFEGEDEFVGEAITFRGTIEGEEGDRRL